MEVIIARQELERQLGGGVGGCRRGESNNEDRTTHNHTHTADILQLSLSYSSIFMSLTFKHTHTECLIKSSACQSEGLSNSRKRSVAMKRSVLQFKTKLNK